MTKVPTKKFVMIIKADIDKAYDRISWRYLNVVLLHLGFHHKFICWIISFILQPSFSVIISMAIPFLLYLPIWDSSKAAFCPLLSLFFVQIYSLHINGIVPVCRLSLRISTYHGRLIYNSPYVWRWQPKRANKPWRKLPQITTSNRLKSKSSCEVVNPPNSKYYSQWWS